MQAAIMQGGVISIAEFPDPVPAKGQLLVAPHFTGICGSDLHLQDVLTESAQPLNDEERKRLPVFVPGHEFSASVIDTGPDVDPSWSRGSRVVPMPFMRAGPDYEIVGLSPIYSGGLATLSVVNAEQCIRIPDSIDDDIAALTEPMAVGLHAANLAQRQAGPNLILGCGPVGLAVLLALKWQGRRPILAADFSAERRAMAETLGADIVLDPAEESPFEHWSDLGFSESQVSPLLTPDQIGRGLGPNIFDCVGATGILDNIIQHAPRHTHIIIVGVCPHQDRMTPHEAVVKELSMEFSFAYTAAEFAHSLKLIGEHSEIVSRLVTSRMPISETPSAFERLRTDTNEVKVLIQPSL